MHHMNRPVKRFYASSVLALERRLLHNACMNIAAIRRSRKLSQADLADVAGITQPQLSRAEKGTDGTTLRTLRAIAAALDVPLAALIETRSAAEAQMIAAFQALPPERQELWLKMAVAISQDQP